ncbi:MAG: hypothetical protein JXQ73_28960 [Phycisphaerae bacterium]|nr:hypothetical protein [Phycisphaerae bacterium]
MGATADQYDFLDPSAGLREDIPCPRCGYDLRGLLNPRCPECAFTFDWSDIPSMRPKPKESYVDTIVALSVGFLILLLVLSALGRDAFLVVPYLVFVVVVMAITAALPGTVECMIGSLFVGPVTGRRIRAWSEGVFIWHGALAVSLLCFGSVGSGRDVLFGLPLATANPWTALFFFLGGASIIQVWVIRRRGNQWGDVVPMRRLIPAVLTAKAVTTVLWVEFLLYA